MKKVSRLWNALVGLGPAALLLIFAAGNTAPMCGEIEPLDPICEAASDCEGLPHIMCEGEWSCESNLCQWDCDADPDPDPDPDPEGVCTNNLECDEGQHCSVIDGDCLPAPGCDADKMGCPLVCYGVCVDDDEPDPVCYGDWDCAEGEECVIDGCESQCDGFAPCAAECMPVGHCQENAEPEGCWDDSDCPSGFYCEFGWCGTGPGECLPLGPQPECYSDHDCPAGYECAMTVSCYDCGEDDWCEPGCFEDGGVCVPEGPAPECYEDSDCLPGQYCQLTCLAVDCWDGWCPDEEMCHGMCVDNEPPPPPDECYIDEDCPPGSVCELMDDCPDCPGGGDCGPCYVYGICMPDPGCPEFPCPPGFQFDPETCECANLPGTCMISGCSAEICAPQPMDSYCVWEPWFECYSDQITTCGPYGPEGECMWEPTPEFFACMSKHF